MISLPSCLIRCQLKSRDATKWRVLRAVLQNDPREVRYEISPALDQPYFLPNAIPEHASALFGVFQPGI
jgi:hypothetical protein